MSISGKTILDAYIEKVRAQFASAPSAQSRLEFVLISYRWLLAGQPPAGWMKEAFRLRIQKALTTAVGIFQDMTVNEASRVQGWYEGRPASNCVERLARIMASLINEFEMALIADDVSD